MAGQLSNKVAIVTGASSGLGEAIAILFASRGAKVTLCGRDPDRLRAVFDEAVKTSGDHKQNFLAVQGDVNKQSVRAEIVKKTVEKFGCLDILVPNAGVCLPNACIRTSTEKTYDLTMDINLKSVFFLIQQALPHLEKTKGAIIGVSSVASEITASPSNIYAISKAGLDHMFRCQAVDLGPKGVRVNTVNPSYILGTLVYDREDFSVPKEAVIESEVAKQPLEGRLGTPKDVAELVAFLASDAAAFITGENVRVDGGRKHLGMSGQLVFPDN